MHKDDGNRLHNGIAVVLLGLLVALCLTSMRFQSPTSDEQNHISRGYHYLVTGNLDLNVAPPFVNALSGLPLLLQKGIIIPRYDTTHRTTYINEFAENFVWVYNDAETVVNSGRLAIILLSVLLAPSSSVGPGICGAVRRDCLRCSCTSSIRISWHTRSW